MNLTYSVLSRSGFVLVAHALLFLVIPCFSSSQRVRMEFLRMFVTNIVFIGAKASNGRENDMFKIPNGKIKQ